MFQTTRRLLAFSQSRPMQLIGALHKGTLRTPFSVSVETRAFQTSSKNDISFSTWTPGSPGVFPFPGGHVRAIPTAKRYFGPINMLLQWCFDSHYMIAPGGAPLLPNEKWGPHLVNFSISPHDNPLRPVMIVDIQDDSWFEYAELRARADERIHGRMERAFWDCAGPRKLWGVSLLGTRMRVYLGDVAARTIEPAFQSRPDELPRDFMAEEWAVDILSPEGFKKMQAIVLDIFDSKHLEEL